MTSFLLRDGTPIDVPSLGFGPAWRPARRLLSQLHRVRTFPLEPRTGLDLFFSLLGIEAKEHDLLEIENRLWRSLFLTCQSRAGYRRREALRHLAALPYADRHVYEQFLLFGEAPRDAFGLKKNASSAPTANGSESDSSAASNGFASSSSASPSRANSPRPTSSPSVRPKGTKRPSGRCLPFWIRPSPRPTTTPASISSNSSPFLES